jgi:membrane fusion protein (multidrug efflux system)
VRRLTIRRLASLAASLAFLTLAACSNDQGGAATPASAAPTRDGAGGGAGNAPGGRPAPTIALSESDVLVIQRGPIDDAISVSGDLHPIETIDVKARLEGDLTGVYVREGAPVRAGQLLARFEASEEESDFRSAEADRAAAQSELATEQWNAEQTEELFKAGAIPERDLRAAQQSVASARARLAAADARVRATSSVLRDTRVVAPTTGIVARRLVEDGEHVARGASMFTVVRNDVLELAAAVPARQANEVAAGQTVSFTADGRSLVGRVARVSPTVDPTTRAITVYVQVPNSGGAIKGGTFATGRVVGRTIPDAPTVPTTALRQTQQGGTPFVYTLADRTIDIAQVRLGIVDETRGVAQVVEGLKEGDRVIVGNVGTLGRGMRVNIIVREGER